MLRYFSPEELLALFGFDPTTFRVYDDSRNSSMERMFGNRKCYELIGNSLNVIVVKELLHHLFSTKQGS